jgi:hypothetical protein
MDRPWNIPKIWEGSTVFILGGGPSLSSVNFDLIKHRRIISTNNAFGEPNGKTHRYGKEDIATYKARDWVDVIFFADLKWFRWHRRSIREAAENSIVLTCNQNNGVLKTTGPWLKKVRRNNNRVLGITSDKKDHISWNRSTGAAAINVAYHFGAKTVVLLGFDMRLIDGKKNYHDDHKEPAHDPCARHLKCFKAIARDAAKLGLNIINCTPGSAIEYFPIMSLEEYLKNEKTD